jgi:hypothetical protein
MTHYPEFKMVFDPAQAIGDPLGMWCARPARVNESGLAPEVAIWRVALPASQGRAEKGLRRSAARLRCAQAALPQAEARLQGFTSELPRIGLEFTLPSGQAYTAERQLQAFLARAQRAGGQSYGWDDLMPVVRELMEAVDRLAENVRLSLASYALVETSQGGHLLGRTRVSWLGDFVSEWGAGLNSDRAVLHQRAVTQVLETRQSWVRIALFTAVGSANLATFLAGNPLAFLGVYGFTRQVIGEFQKLVSGDGDTHGTKPDELWSG